MILCETTNVGKSPLHIVDKIILILDVYLSALDSIYIPSIKMRRRWTDGRKIWYVARVDGEEDDSFGGSV